MAKPGPSTSEVKGRGWLQRARRAAKHNPELAAYLNTLRLSNCPGCGHVQYTVGGKPITCPRCAGRKGTVDEPSLPLEAARRKPER